MKKAEDSQLNYNEEAVTCVKKNEMIPDEYVTKLASFFKSVSEENRVRMIFALSSGEMCVNDIAAGAWHFPISGVPSVKTVKARRTGEIPKRGKECILFSG